MTKHLQNKKIKAVLLALLLGLSGTASLLAQNITFADANVKALCVAPATGWDTNSDGELSYAEAAAVTSIGTVFKGKSNIQSFNELEHFISLTAIDEKAFMNCTSLTEITIPENIATISDKAFVNCPALATVHFNAINCTSMSTVYNDENYSVFMSNQTTSPLTNLTFGNHVQNIPNYAFKGCNNIQNFDIPASVTTVGQYAFFGCNQIQNLDIPASVTTVGEYAFYGCTSLETLTIGEGMISIGGNAFWNCPALTTVHFNATNCTQMYEVFKSGTNSDDPGPIVTLTIGENVTGIPDRSFYGCSSITGSLTIPNSVTSIGNETFEYCSGFTGSLTIPNSVTSIGDFTFYGCSGFTGSLTIPNSVTSIGCCAFAYCSGFTGNLTIGNSVISIGDVAFAGCTGFTGNLIIPKSETSLGTQTFAGCSGFTALITETPNVPSPGYGAFDGMNYAIPVYVPAGKVSEYQSATGWNVFTNYVNQVNFEQDSNDQWSDDFNWSSWKVPGSEDVVCITDNCQLDMDANVLYVYMRNDDDVLTINSGHTLNTTYGVHIENASQLVIEDGAQLYNPLPGTQATVKKGIEGYGADENGGYLLITNPVQETLSPANLGMTTGEYDLYRFDQYEDLEWRNYKQTPFDLENGQGYLYANSTNTNIDFCGTLNPSNTDITVDLAYDTTAQYAGFNLVGNPFVCNAYIDRPFYTMNDEGSEIVSVTDNSVEAGEGIFVVATAENETLTFTTTAPENNSKAMLVLNLIQGRGASTGSAATVIDRAIVRFDQGSLLPKFQMKSNSTNIYIPLDNTDYAVVNAESQGEMPVNFKAKEDGSYTLSLGRDEMAFNYLHLIDNLTGNDVDMLVNPSYSFEAKTTDYASRFKLVFSTICEDTDGDNDTFAFISNGNIIVNCEGMLQVIDMMGRVIVSGDAIIASLQTG